jgi:hypothetical protein
MPVTMGPSSWNFSGRDEIRDEQVDPNPRVTLQEAGHERDTPSSDPSTDKRRAIAFTTRTKINRPVGRVPPLY